MADAMEIQIADAVVSELNDPARNWSLAFAAEQCWLPVYQAEELANLKVAVVALTIAQEQADRARDQFSYVAGIDLQQMVAPNDTAAMNGLSRLAEEIHDFYRDWHALATLTSWKVRDARREDVYDLSRLYAEHTWETLILLTVRGYR